MLAAAWAKQLVDHVRSLILPRSRSRRKATRIPALLEQLEPRSLLSGLVIQFDYSLDTTSFFNTQAKKDLLAQAAQVYTNRISDDLRQIRPNVNIGNTWDALVTNPVTGNQQTFSNLSIATDTIVVYVGGRDLPSDTLAEGGPGGFNVSGAQDWIDTVTARGQSGALASPKTDIGMWGGSISFDTVGTNWYFGATTSGLGATQTDFLTVATHELGHVLGFGTSDAFDAQRSGPPNGLVFNGAKSVARYGGPVPLDPDGSHWSSTVTDGGQETLMDPIVHNGTRKTLTELDFKALDDIGWADTSGNVRMLRTYAPSVDTHFFTTSTSEFKTVVASGTFQDEATNQQGFAVPDTKVGGAVAIHRLYNPNDSRHYYTANDSERDFLVNAGWRYEKDEGNIYTTQVTGTTEIFRLYNKNSGEHLYIEDAAEKNAILAQFPGIWEQHSSMGYAYVSPATSTFPTVPQPERSAGGTGSTGGRVAAAHGAASNISHGPWSGTSVQEVRLDNATATAPSARQPFVFTVTVGSRDESSPEAFANDRRSRGGLTAHHDTLTHSRDLRRGGTELLSGSPSDDSPDIGATFVDDVWRQLGADRELAVFCET